MSDNDFAIFRKIERNMGMTYDKDIGKYLEGLLGSMKIPFKKETGKADASIIPKIADNKEIYEIKFLIRPAKSGIIARLKKDETINNIEIKIYNETKLIPFVWNDSCLRYVQSGSDGNYEKIGSIHLIKS